MWFNYRRLQRPRLPIKRLKLRRFDNTISEFCAYFTAHAQKRLFRSFQSKIWHRHLLRRSRFPIIQMYFHYRVTFTGYIRCFCATTSHDFVTLTFDLLTLKVFHEQCFSCPTNISYQFLASYDSRLLSYELLNLVTFLLSGTVIAHAPCRVTYYRGNGPHFWNPDPYLPIQFVICRALRRRLSHVIGENSV